nr:NAD(P)(+)--arginine ADP-ribosyltransferase 2-like [Misgurnus anguillicaudatus]
MLTTAALILIVTTKVVLGQDDRQPDVGQICPLDMALDSVDDMYDGCTMKMEKLVKPKFLKQEICENITQFAAWINIRGLFPKSKTLKMHQLIAISVYTGNEVYGKFNLSVRSGRQNGTHNWYSLHFLLTEAIQILKETQQRCMITYLGTKLTYNETVLNTEIRFGSFASSSTKQDVAMGFGNESCFEIKTCYSADVSKCFYLPYKKEVPINFPYDKFKVIQIKKRACCDTMFVLESSGTQSNLNCTMASVNSRNITM